MIRDVLFSAFLATALALVYVPSAHAWGGYQVGFTNYAPTGGYQWSRAPAFGYWSGPSYGQTPSGYGNAYGGRGGYVGHWGGAYYGGYHYSPSYYGPLYGGVRMNP